MSKRKRRTSQNKKAIIVSQPQRAATGRTILVTSTERRDDDLDIAVQTDTKRQTILSMGNLDFAVSLTGRQARTLFRVLEKHYRESAFRREQGTF